MHDLVETDDRLYIVLDLARGGDFFEYILALYGEGHTFSEDEGRAYFRQLINGVEACHAVGIAHRDLKPENLLLREIMTPGTFPPEGTLMISDFGLSNWFRSQEDSTHTMLGTPCGSTKYAAPEIIQGKGMYVPSSIDIWSCGVVLYIMFAGQFPFTEATAKCDLFVKYSQGTFVWPAHFAPDLVELLSGMLCIDPKTRLTIDLIKQSKWWRTGLPTEVEASPFAVEVMEDGEEMHMQPELHRLPTVQQVAEPNPGMSGEPNFHEVHEDMEVDEVKYRSLSFTNSTESENTPSADYLTAVCKVDACPQSRYDRLQLEAAKLRCSGNPACVRKLEEEMATLYSRAALGRLSSRLESASPEKVLVCDDEEDEMRHSAISRTTADFGATKARYRLVLPVASGKDALSMVSAVVTDIFNEKSAQLQGMQLSITPSAREPEMCIKIEVSYQGSIILMAARLEDPDHPVVCFTRRSGCHFDFHRLFTEIRNRLEMRGSTEAPMAMLSQSEEDMLSTAAFSN
eukprot:TRINITY_DN2968_c0_g1_i1.p1 TRINITY_DN2968_c0_g1~~TRINITY_DN2968_c0_g1_i1.p1  ORF type:complete len:515 (-),score=102.46 TRINITY_DN2968_c0_g1_i1:101-1645(-)